MALVFRKAEAADKETVLLFYENIITKRTERDYKLWWNLEIYPTRQDLANAVDSQSMYLMMMDGNIVSAAVLNSEQGDGYENVSWACNPDPTKIGVVHLVAVDPDQRGLGIGKQLMEALTGAARERGIQSLRLDTMPHYSSAIQLYEKLGFIRRGEIELFYPSTGTMSFYLYELDL